MTTQSKVAGVLVVAVLAAAIPLAVNWWNRGAPEAQQAGLSSQEKVEKAMAEVAATKAGEVNGAVVTNTPKTGAVEATTGANPSTMDAAGKETAESSSGTTASAQTANRDTMATAPAAPATVATSGPLNMTLPEGWTVTPPTGKMDYYEVTLSLNPLERFDLGPWKNASSQTDTKTALDIAAQAQAEAAQAGGEKAGVEEGAIPGTAFAGNYLTFTRPDGTVHTQFLLSDGQTLWNGKFYGSESGWEQVKEVLSTMTKN